ncbi:hypothetical protein SCLCIDRAFT_396529 [Scleroderma citrinum Foug A]|uniref:Uncharacterized protein n=1 Tax=Scleroderma citrinum Foug A TaxID=1036808 RepID=A0A0C3DZP2_9AGAM|nr:hypothetical protein SCLCIDRAFT_396529 [Scleroderma citrinum Foug A]
MVQSLPANPGLADSSDMIRCEENRGETCLVTHACTIGEPSPRCAEPKAPGKVCQPRPHVAVQMCDSIIGRQARVRNVPLLQGRNPRSAIGCTHA